MFEMLESHTHGKVLTLYIVRLNIFSIPSWMVLFIVLFHVLWTFLVLCLLKYLSFSSILTVYLTLYSNKLITDLILFSDDTS